MGYFKKNIFYIWGINNLKIRIMAKVKKVGSSLEGVSTVKVKKGSYTKEIKPATLGGKVEDLEVVDPVIEEEVNSVESFNEEMDSILEEEVNNSMELTEEVLDEIMKEEERKEEARTSIREATKHYLNGYNEWKLISKTWNEFLGWEQTVTAMPMGKMGVLVCVKEGFGNQTKLSTSYVPDSRLYEEDGKWLIK